MRLITAWTNSCRVPHKFRTTLFRWGNHKAPGAVTARLIKIPADEKYHWYRMPGKLELRPVSYFWGQGWAIQANTSHLYTLTDGDPLDNAESPYDWSKLHAMPSIHWEIED